MDVPKYPDYISGPANELLQLARIEVVHFRSAIALAEIAFQGTGSMLLGEQNKAEIVTRWPYIAADTAIGTLFQFQEILMALVTLSSEDSECQKVREPGAATRALERFEQHFPKWSQMRHATAHSAEIQLNPTKNWHMGPLTGGLVGKPKGARVMISDCFEDRTFITTRKGELLRFPVTSESYAQLLEVYEILRIGFSKPEPPKEG